MKNNIYKSNIARIQNNIEELSTFVNKNEKGWTRKSFTSYYKEGRNWLIKKMEELGLQVRYDAASNLIGTIQGKNGKLPKIIIGSHTDTVSGGGRFDGIVGVLAALEAVNVLKENNITLNHSIEIVDFTAEEPTEFGISTVGSRGMVNKLTEEMLFTTDHTGVTLKEKIKDAGGNPEIIAIEARKPGDVLVYLELHIEQGPVLYNLNKKLGIVTGIVAIQRYRIIVTGMANHAGTTPMDARFDALAAASEIMLSIESICKESYEENVVGTVGKLIVEPNAPNVIPGKVIFEFEIRCIDNNVLDNIIEKLQIEISNTALTRKVDINLEGISKSDAVRINEDILKVIESTCRANGDSIFISSGAGHDGNHIADIAPIGMIFIPSKDGKSHCAEEWSNYEDVALGTDALVDAMIEFDRI